MDRWILIAERISTRIRIGDLVSQCMYVHMYIRGSQALGTLMNRFPACGFPACGFLAACPSFLCHKDGTRFSTLKSNGRACNAFRSCRVRAATRGAKTVSTQHLYTTAPHTADNRKLGGAWKWGQGTNRAVRACSDYSCYMWSWTVSVVDISVPHSKTHTTIYTLASAWSGHTYAQGVGRSDADTYS